MIPNGPFLMLQASSVNADLSELYCSALMPANLLITYLCMESVSGLWLPVVPAAQFP